MTLKSSCMTQHLCSQSQEPHSNPSIHEGAACVPHVVSGPAEAADGLTVD